MNLIIFRTDITTTSTLLFDGNIALPCDVNDRKAMLKLGTLLHVVLDNAHVENCLIFDDLGMVFCTPGFELRAQNALYDTCNKCPKLRHEIQQFIKKKFEED